MLNFTSWMRSEGLSKSSVLKYHGAMEGALSEWALAAGLTQNNLLEITNKSKFDAVALKIKELPIFKERNSTGHKMYSSALNKYSEFLAKGGISSIEEDIEQIVEDTGINTTEKAQLINVRLGQGVFRSKLLDYWGQCAVTGVRDTGMLLASHIKPWSKCGNEERLDQFNGLLLTPNLDRAFDQGLISFSPVGNILISSAFPEAEAFGINRDMFVSLVPEHFPYMEYHRTNVFRTEEGLLLASSVD